MTAERPKGRVILLTGEGKGKTTAALGLALRAAGHDMKTCVVQFIKGRTDVGEVRAAARLGGHLEILPCGAGFVRERGGTPEDREKAAEALQTARDRMNRCGLLVLDEINQAVDLGLLEVSDVLEVLRSRPEPLHIVLTGRGAPPELVAEADTVTEMTARKHAYDSGAPAVPGIEY